MAQASEHLQRASGNEAPKLQFLAHPPKFLGLHFSPALQWASYSTARKSVGPTCQPVTLRHAPLPVTFSHGPGGAVAAASGAHGGATLGLCGGHLCCQRPLRRHPRPHHRQLFSLTRWRTPAPAPAPPTPPPIARSRPPPSTAATTGVVPFAPFTSASSVCGCGTHFGGPLQLGLGGKFSGGTQHQGFDRSSAGEEKLHVHPLKPDRGMDRSSQWRCSMR
jgi:hypothetical protein